MQYVNYLLKMIRILEIIQTGFQSLRLFYDKHLCQPSPKILNLPFAPICTNFEEKAVFSSKNCVMKTFAKYGHSRFFRARKFQNY